MEKHINNKKQKISMRKILMFIIISLFMSNIAFGTHASLISWQFEEGGGSLIFDETGNGNNGLVTGALWTANKKFGNYGIEFDGINDWADLIAPVGQLEEFTLSFWMDIDTLLAGETYSIISARSFDNRIYRVKAVYNAGNTQFYLEVLNDDNITEQDVLLETFAFSNTQYYHILIEVETITNRITYFRDNVLIYNNTVGNGIANVGTDNFIARIGARIDGSQDYDGVLDSFQLYNFLLNSSQRTELYTTNQITFSEIEPEEEPTAFNKSIIIDYHEPLNNTNVSNPVNFIINLNKKANCELYLNNDLYQTFYNQISYTYDVVMESGDYEYFIYCSYIENSTLFYELSDTVYFEVLTDEPGLVIFTIDAKDFNPDLYALYIMTPCMKRGLYVPTVSNGYNPPMNNEPFYIQRIVDNLAVFNISNGDKEFCLVNGQISYDEGNYTENYYVTTMLKNLNLGIFNIQSNSIQSYNIGLENTDIFKITDPKFWGQTWASIIGSLIGLSLGIILMTLGIITKSPQLIIVGGFLTLGSLGYQIGSVIWGIL